MKVFIRLFLFFMIFGFYIPAQAQSINLGTLGDWVVADLSQPVSNDLATTIRLTVAPNKDFALVSAGLPLISLSMRTDGTVEGRIAEGEAVIITAVNEQLMIDVWKNNQWVRTFYNKMPTADTIIYELATAKIIKFGASIYPVNNIAPYGEFVLIDGTSITYDVNKYYSIVSTLQSQNLLNFPLLSS